ADLTAQERRPRGHCGRIEDLLYGGQDVLVQVSRDGIGNKGPTLTTYVSVPGKYMVLMPSLARVGVSKKVSDEGARRRLKEIIAGLEAPPGMGFIVRTAGADCGVEELRKDLTYLVNLWESIVRRVRACRAPANVYRESDLLIRTIRDVFDAGVKEMVVDSPDEFARACELLLDIMPEHRTRLRLHEDETPLFESAGVEKQIERIFQHRVPLPSGGSLVIEPTEALVAIDVNSGRFRSEADLEDTAFCLNMEAIPEICRQLRLRDLGGLIVVDMVDMRDLGRRREVERAFLTELRRDKARVRMAPISEFGVVEITRQRVRPSLRQEIYVRCGTCHGTGAVKSVESVALTVLRELPGVLRKDGAGPLEVTVRPEVAEVLKEGKSAAIADLSGRYGRAVLVKGDPALPPDAIRFSGGRRS
ncbi:MAG: Rne/Rng family ribonuclease, partial [Planctomycetes bacterium]|nr:Rne/Rng family ribonuclease [Planctomycetota bacterium]